MKRFFFLVVMMISCDLLVAQDHHTTFLNKNFAVTDSVNAAYKRTIMWLEDDLYKLSDFYMPDNVLHQEYTYKLLSNRRQEKVGMHKSFYRNGNIQHQVNYIEGEKVGIFKYWYSNGNLRSEYIYTDTLDVEQGYLIHSFYDSLGNQLVTEGNGVLRSVNDNSWSEGEVHNGLKTGLWKGGWPSSTYEEIYENGNLISGISTDSLGRVHEYTEMEQSAEYPGGIERFYQHVAARMKYPKKAKKLGIQGKVYVQFIVDKTGSITDVKVIKGIGAGCDEEALQAVQTAEKFSVPLQRGIPVKQRIVLPLTFRLK